LGEVPGKFGFAPEAGRAEFADGARVQFELEELLPGCAAGVAEADPGEVEVLVGEDAGVFQRVGLERRVEVDFAAADVGGADGVTAAVAEVRIPADANGFTVRWG
jgi:hypothetical protein